MNRIYLNVPFAEKDEAKALGAKWDPDARKWYVPDGGDVSRFSRWHQATDWIRQDLEALRHDDGSPSAPAGVKVFAPLYLAESLAPCWKCKERTPVVALAAAQVVLDGQRLRDVTLVCNVRELPAPLVAVLAKAWPRYRPDYSKQAGGRYFMNHCGRCDAKVGDFFMHDEPDGAFFPTSLEAARQIVLRAVDLHGSFEIVADVTTSSPNLIHSHARRA